MTETRSDCESLLNALLPFAKQMLQQHGEFFPYGGAMAPDGTIELVSGFDGSENPLSKDIISLLNDGFKNGAVNKKYKATALVYIVHTTLSDGRKSDAVSVQLDHIRDYSQIVTFPINIQNGNFDFNQREEADGNDEIFTVEYK